MDGAKKSRAVRVNDTKARRNYIESRVTYRVVVCGYALSLQRIGWIAI